MTRFLPLLSVLRQLSENLTQSSPLKHAAGTTPRVSKVAKSYYSFSHTAHGGEPSVNHLPQVFGTWLLESVLSEQSSFSTVHSWQQHASLIQYLVVAVSL